MDNLNRNELVTLGIDLKLTQQDVADIFGISRERVRQIYNQVREKPIGARKRVGPFVNPQYIYCNQCGKKFKKGSRGRFCSNKCNRNYYYYSPTPRVCFFCQRQYYPHRNRDHYDKKLGLKRNFCKRDHYLAYQSAKGFIKKEFNGDKGRFF